MLRVKFSIRSLFLTSPHGLIGNVAVKDLKTEEEVFKTNAGGHKVIAVRFPPNNNDVLVVTEAGISLYSQTGSDIYISLRINFISHSK